MTRLCHISQDGHHFSTALVSNRRIMFLVFTSAVDFIAAFCRAKLLDHGDAVLQRCTCLWIVATLYRSDVLVCGSWRRCTAAMYLSVDRGDAVPQRCTCLWIEATLYRSDVLVCVAVWTQRNRATPAVLTHSIYLRC